MISFNTVYFSIWHHITREESRSRKKLHSRRGESFYAIYCRRLYYVKSTESERCCTKCRSIGSFEKKRYRYRQAHKVDHCWRGSRIHDVLLLYDSKNALYRSRRRRDKGNSRGCQNRGQKPF